MQRLRTLIQQLPPPNPAPWQNNPYTPGYPHAPMQTPFTPQAMYAPGAPIPGLRTSYNFQSAAMNRMNAADNRWSGVGGGISPFGGLSGFNSTQLLSHFRSNSWYGQTLDRQALDRILRSAMPALNDPQAQSFLNECFSMFDVNKDGRIDWRELSLGLAVLSSGTTHDRLCAIFGMFDKDGSGAIEFMELVYLVSVLSGNRGNMKSSEVQAERMMREMDRDRNGRLTFDEFVQWQGTKASRFDS